MMVQHVRNFGISAHVDAGKSTLAERILFDTGRIRTMGDVRDGGRGVTLDHDPQEQDRGITIRTATASCTWEGHRLDLVDTPGHIDFTIEVERALRVVDGAVLVLCAVAGVQAQTHTVERQMARYGVPRIAFVNKCDREGADPARVVAQLRELGVNAALVQVPVGSGAGFEGVVELVDNRSAVPPSEAFEALLDALGQFDDTVVAAVLDDREPTAEELRAAIRRGVLARVFVPVFVGSAQRNLGVRELLDGIVAYLPSPRDRQVVAQDVDGAPVRLVAAAEAPTVAMAFKRDETPYGSLTWLRLYQGTLVSGTTLSCARTGERRRISRLARLHAGKQEPVERAEAGDIVAALGLDVSSGETLCDPSHVVSVGAFHVPEPVVECALSLVSGTTEDLSKALGRFVREDPSLRVRTDAESGETRLAGMGELHLEVVATRVRDDFGCTVHLGAPRVAMRQTPTRVAAFDHVLRKQNGGPGLYARVVGRLEPAERDSFVWQVTGGAIPAEYRSAVERGFTDGLADGGALDCPVLGARVVVTDGDIHSNDSSEQAFYLAARDACREALARSEPALLEPWMEVVAEATVDRPGPVLALLQQRGAQVSDVVDDDGVIRVSASVPLRRMFGFAGALRNVTGGTGTFSMEFARYATA